MSVLSHAYALYDATVEPELCQDPVPLLAAVAGVLEATAEGETVSPEGRRQATHALNYLAERVAAVDAIANGETPVVNALHAALPRRAARAPPHTLLHDVARGLARRMPLAKLI